MKHLVLEARAYGAYRGKLLQAVRADFADMARELSAKLVKLGTNKRNRITIEIEGKDEEFIANVLTREYGTVSTIGALRLNSTHKGHFVDVGKVGYGLYVDIGIATPSHMDALIPLYSLREQLQMRNSSLRTIANTLVLVDNLPVSIRITEVDITSQRIAGEFTESYLEQIDRWVKDDHQRLLVLGCTKELIDDALEKSSHTEDIYRIEKLGHFEYSLRCKRSTRASGILAAIGPRLKGVPMHLFIPEEIGEKYHAKT